MWKCMICGQENETGVCPECGQLREEDFVAARTLCPVPEEYRESACQKALVYGRNSDCEAELESLQIWNRELLQEVERLKQENRTLQQELERLKGGGEELPEAELSSGEKQLQPVEGSWQNNCLKRDSMKLFSPAKSMFYGLIPREKINTITFLSSLEALPPESQGGYTVDVSQHKNRSVILRLLLQNSRWNAYFAAEGGINGEIACSRLFAYCANLTEIHFNGCFHTDRAASMANAFEECRSLTSLDLSGFDTSNVRSMSKMFFNCAGLTKLNLTGFQTAQVGDMSFLFYGCKNLQEADVSGFQTAKVENMSHMFYGCESLTEADLSGFDTSQVVNMTNMFRGCKKLQKVDVSSFNTRKTTDMSHMFYGCRSLKQVDITHFIFSKNCAKGMMFSGCKAKVIR